MTRSALAHALDLIGDRWTLLIVDVLLKGPHRFNELSGGLDGIAPNILAKRLRQLEADGLIRSSLYSLRPPRARYELSASGEELADAAAILAAWGGRRSGNPGSIPHDACGTPLELRLWCPTCELPITRSNDATELDWL